MTDTKGTPIKWEDVSVRVDKWKRLQALCEEVEPHEHYDGMNECNICDEPLTDVLIRHCETLLTARRALTAAQAELAALLEAHNNLRADYTKLRDSRAALLAELETLVSYVDRVHNDINQPVAMRIAANSARAAIDAARKAK